jgi:elongation factor G
MDSLGADFFVTVAMISERLHARPLVLQVPIGAEAQFRGCIDLVSMTAVLWESASATPTLAAVPDELRPQAEALRRQLLEQIVEQDDDALAIYLEDEHALDATRIKALVRKGCIAGRFSPVLCGSAYRNIGVQPLLDAVVDFCPAPADRPPVEGVDPRTGASVIRAAAADAPLTAMVSKLQMSRFGALAYVRVYAGRMVSGMRIANAATGRIERVGRILHMQADDVAEIAQASAGDIVAVTGLRSTRAGDTLSDRAHPIVLSGFACPDPVIEAVIEPRSADEQEKLSQALATMVREDPSLRVSVDPETGQTLISGMGELHLEVVQHKLLRDFRLNVKVHKPRVSYRETVAKAAEVVGESSRMIQGTLHAAKVRIRLEPFAKGATPLTVTNALNHGLPSEMLTVVLEELENAGQGGGLLGFPLMRLKATVLGGEVADTGVSEIAFRTATNHAFDQALRAAGPVLLEPIMKLEISTPDEHVGDLVSDLQQRRAILQSTESRGTATVLHAEAPLANLFGYSSAMRSLSQGRASCSMEPSTYAPAPDEVLQKFLGES